MTTSDRPTTLFKGKRWFSSSFGTRHCPSAVMPPATMFASILKTCSSGAWVFPESWPTTTVSTLAFIFSCWKFVAFYICCTFFSRCSLPFLQCPSQSLSSSSYGKLSQRIAGGWRAQLLPRWGALWSTSEGAQPGQAVRHHVSRPNSGEVCGRQGWTLLTIAPYFTNKFDSVANSIQTLNILSSLLSLSPSSSDAVIIQLIHSTVCVQFEFCLCLKRVYIHILFVYNCCRLLFILLYILFITNSTTNSYISQRGRVEVLLIGSLFFFAFALHFLFMFIHQSFP